MRDIVSARQQTIPTDILPASQETGIQPNMGKAALDRDDIPRGVTPAVSQNANKPSLSTGRIFYF